MRTGIPALLCAALLAAQSNLTGLYSQHRWEQYRLQRQHFYQSWASIRFAAAREDAQMRAALETCRKSKEGCHSRFQPIPGFDKTPGALAASLAQDPAARARIQELAARYLEVFRQVAVRHELAANEVAPALAYCYLSALRVNRQDSAEADAAARQAATAQAREKLANNGRMALMNGEQRQIYRESFGVIGVYFNVEYESARAANDTVALARLRSLATQVLKDIGGTEPAGGVPGSGAGQAPVTFVPDAAKTTTFAFNPRAVLVPSRRASWDRFQSLVRSNGGDPNDLAWGSVVAFGVNYYLAREVRLTPRQLQGTYSLARQLILQSGQGAGSTERDRQQAYERLALKAMDNLEAREHAMAQRAQSGDIGFLLRANRDLALATIEVMLSPYRLADFDLTPEGLVKRR